MEAVITLLLGAIVGWLSTHVYHVRQRRRLEQTQARPTAELRRIRDIVVAARGVDGKVQLTPGEADEIMKTIEKTMEKIVGADTVLRIP